MIEELSVRGFKRFSSLTLPLRSLTVLTGPNGTGKSTVVQSLLLARQAARRSSGEFVLLNGPDGLALGEAEDVLHPDASRVEVGLRAGTQEYGYVLVPPGSRSLNLRIEDGPPLHWPALAGRGTAFTYLSAERLGPRDQLAVIAEEPGKVGIGPRGEHTAQVLALNDMREIRPELRHPDTGKHGVRTLRTQVENWVADLLRPIRISAHWPAGLSSSHLRFEETGLQTGPIRPANVGFGFSYALPILVAALLAPEQGILIVENPEAHLHPAGQSRLGRFLARVAGSGVQVVVETHSDHVINGVRLAVAQDRVLACEDGVFHFFGERDDGGPVEIGLTDRGELSQWPQGFFDQIEFDLGELTRAKRKNL